MLQKSKIFPLSSGRRLSYSEYGDPVGFPLFFFHGQPGNRLFHYPDDYYTASLGIHLITIDRPGYGNSDYQPGRKLSDDKNRTGRSSSTDVHARN